MGLWAWYKRRWFEKLDEGQRRNEELPLRQALAIEVNRVALFDLKPDELPLASLAGYVACDWPTVNPTDGMYDFLRDSLFIEPSDLDRLGDADPPNGTALRFQNALLLLTNKRLLVRLLREGGRSPGLGRYATYSSSSMRPAREFDVESIWGARLDPVEPFQVLIPRSQPRTAAEEDAVTASAVLAIRVTPHGDGTEPVIRGPRWPNLDAGKAPSLQMWTGVQTQEDFIERGVVFACTPLTIPPYGLSLPVFGVALDSVGAPVKGAWWNVAVEDNLREDWLTVHEAIADLRRQLSPGSSGDNGEVAAGTDPFPS